MSGFSSFLTQQDIVILDGALATELQARGYDLNDPLWSAKILMESPSIIKQVHYDYLTAGADCITTASYQATIAGFKNRGLSETEAIQLIKRSVELAREARSDYLKQNQSRPLFIAGSVGPYGAFLADGSEYTGNYQLSDDAMSDFHRMRLEALIQSGADVIAFETMPSFSEIKVLVELIQHYPQIPCWFALTLKDSEHLSDGTPIETVLTFLESFEQVVAVGVNCIPLDQVTSALLVFNQSTHKPLIVYPNSGETYDPVSKIWQNKGHYCNDLSFHALEWHKLNAKIIGGCCRTRPLDIEKLVNKIKS